MRQALESKVAVVTGAGRGIGRAVALALAREGADLVLAARSVPELERVAEEARSLGRRAVVVPTDVTDEAAVACLVASATAEFDRIDIVVNNAGWGAFKYVVEMSLQEWEDTIAVNLRSAFLVTRGFARHMIGTGGGCILNMSSMSAHRGLEEYAAYSAAKAGMLRLTETAAAELKPHGIRVVALCPGPTASRLRSYHFPEEDPSTIMTPETVAEAALFLVSVAASGISGTHLNINHY